MRNHLEQNGFTIVADVFDGAQLHTLGDALAQLPSGSAGVRGLLAKSPELLQLAQSAAIRQMVEPILGGEAAVVRSVFFNKTIAVNWQVAWHQDLAIAVKQRIPMPGFGGWSLKDGIPHVQPPAAILERMLTVRIHLDTADAENGALWVVAKSHRLGRMPADSAAQMAADQGKLLCPVGAGGVMLFRPLLLHASRKATTACPRRVIHFEFAAKPLPGPLAWWEWVC